MQGPVSQSLFATQHLSTEWLMGIKMLLAGIAILAYVKFGKHQKLNVIWQRPKNRWVMLIYSLLGLSAVQYLYLLTVKNSNAATTTVMQSLGTVLIVIFTIFISRSLPQTKEIIAVGLAIIGTWLLVTKGDINHLAISKTALIFGLLLALAGALQTMIPVKLIAEYGSLLVIGWAMLIGGIVFSVCFPFWKNAPTLTLGTVLGVGFIVIFGTILAYICFMQSLAYISPTVAGLLDTFEPLAATLGMVLFLNTSFSWIEALGMLLAISTVFVLSVKTPKK
ncbi:DMT family transporter [Lentilactobacillus laojiaonis]|uniref:DMT family transporter n=1 Tax=Lentilactobacillus laojiaonis TaxID=2883998 RepID=UPI00201B9D4F|nr:EamA family transporter [Lentilactobacillus laojiaonis]